MFRRSRKKPIRGVVRTGRYYIVPAEGHRVRACSDFVIECTDEKRTRISLVQPFTLIVGESTENIDPSDRSRARQLAMLEGAGITEARADESGRLLLRFDNGIRIEVPPSAYVGSCD